MNTMAMIDYFHFNLSTRDFDRLSRTLSFSFAEIQKAQDYEGSQSVGRDTEEVTISGNITTLRGGLRPLAELEAIAKRKEAVPLVMGYGDILGVFKITKITENRSIFLEDGKSLFVEFSVELKRIGK
ncbi:MAG: phage tail protein [Sulfuricurvum sp.]|nr:phage tail protein [Sulfuricurvum sp.]